MEAKATSAIPVSLKVLGSQGEIVNTGEFVKEKIVLGRILSADLRIDDPRVSRIHALIEVRGDQLIITDLASTHGTWVNGEKIIEHTLKIGDVVRLGYVEILIEKGTGHPSPPDKSFEGRPVLEGDETLLDIDRSLLDQMDRRDGGKDRRKQDAFPDERRLDDRRKGERRVDQRSGQDRRKATSPGTPPVLPPGVEKDRRSGEDRRKTRGFERRIGERRRVDRRIFDITSLERRISERRLRTGDDDLLPDELERAFVTPKHAQELEVTVLWGDHILDVSNYIDPSVLHVGENPRNEYIIPSVGIPEEFPLITIEEDGTAYLAFTEKMKGTVRARDSIYTIPELVKAKFTRKYADHYVVGLKRDDFAKLTIGPVSFFILYVKPAPRILPPPFFDRDALLIRSFIGSLLLLALLFVMIALIPEPTPVTIEMIPERFARIVIKERPKLPLVANETKEGGSLMGEGAKPKEEEGKAGEVEKPKKEEAQVMTPKKKSTQVVTKPSTPKRERKVLDKERAESVGLLKAFNMSGIKSELKNMTEDGGGFTEFGKAVSGLKGKSLEASGGAGGKGLKGVNVGGGGQTIGIDGPSTKGLGRGGVGDGIGEGIAGPGRLGVKGEHTVNIISENVQILSGLPKDVVNAIVQRHRAEIRACYDAALQRNPAIKGKIVMAFRIEPNGIVSSARVTENSLGDGGLGACITARVKSWIFPKPEAPVPTEVSAYPFYLNPAN